MKGLFIPEITAEMFRNGCLESIEALMAEGEIYDIDYSRWIPVSERYPEEEGEDYLVCYDDGTIRIRNLYFTVVDNEPYFEYGQGIVAWMPLPEPYKQETE